MSIAIQCNNISKSYKLFAHRNDQLKHVLFGNTRKFYTENWALRDVSLTIKKGESVGIIGSNGSGKTTLLQILCGITTPTSGDYFIEGRIAPILALGSSFDDLLTGRQNAELGSAILGLSKIETQKKLKYIEKFADIGDAFEYQLRTYSSGMRSRLAFAICVHVDADILIIDEALAVGDESFVSKCSDYMTSCIGRSTILLVSHDLNYIRLKCSKVVWIEKGELKAFGDCGSVVDKYLDHHSHAKS